jgi:hypothetical protein
MAAHAEYVSRGQLAAPTLLPNGIEYSVHVAPRSMRRDLSSVLPGVKIESVLIIPCSQRAAIDLMNIGSDVADEKDRLLESFVAWAEGARKKLLARSAALVAAPSGIAGADPCAQLWLDYVDPCSGLPTHTANVNTIYPEVDTFEVCWCCRPPARRAALACLNNCTNESLQTVLLLVLNAVMHFNACHFVCRRSAP